MTTGRWWLWPWGLYQVLGSAITIPSWPTISPRSSRAVQRPGMGEQALCAGTMLTPPCWDSRTWFSRSPGQDCSSFSHPFPLLLHTLPGTSFSQPREPSRPTSSPSLFLSFPKLTQVQHWLLGRGMEPGNFSQNKGNFGARWDQLQNLWNLAVAGEGPTAPSHF